MDEKDLDSFREYVFVLAFALWGGMANYVSYVRRKRRHPSIFEFLGNLIVSGFSGTLVYTLAEHQGLSKWLIIFTAGMGGYLGAETVVIVEKWIKNKLFPNNHDSNDG